MRRNEYGQSRCSIRAIIGTLAVVMVVLTAVPLAAGTPKKYTHVYGYSFDEVFQAALDTIERNGGFVADKDKEKGTISDALEIAI